MLHTTACTNSLNPVWNRYLSFPIACKASDYLRVVVYDHDFYSRDDVIGEVVIKVRDLTAASKQGVLALPLRMITSARTKEASPSSLSLALVHITPAFKLHAIKKTIFLIRHGESKWNEAQADRNLRGMLKQVRP